MSQVLGGRGEGDGEERKQEEKHKKSNQPLRILISSASNADNFPSFYFATDEKWFQIWRKQETKPLPTKEPCHQY